MVAANLAGFHIQRDHRSSVEVVAGMRVGGPWAGITRAKIGEPQFRIIAARHPYRAAAGLPVIALPGFTAGFARRGYCIGAPCLLAGFRIDRRHKAADAVLGAGTADHHLALGDQRRQREVIVGLVLGELGFPHQLAGARVEANNEGIHRCEVNLVLVERNAAIGRVRVVHVIGELALVAPYLLAGLGV